MRYVIKVAYDGTHFCGWQVQTNGRTVQEELNGAVKKAFGESSAVTASGRTDSGVHAKGQVCHFDLTKDIPPERVADALNCHLPEDVSVLASAAAPEGFDSNRSAKKKTYRYALYVSPRRDPLKDRYAVQIKSLPGVERLNKAAKLFLGEHDFKAYCASGSKVLTTVRTLYDISIVQNGNDIYIDVCGSGFLYNMVRTLVGTLLGYGCGRISEEDIIKSLKECNRSLVGKTMPAKGLTLLDVDYGVQLF